MEKGQGRNIDLTKPELAHLLKSGKYALISAGRNPEHEEDKKLSDEDIESRHGQLESEIKDDGFAYSKVKGHYGGIEDSFLVMIHDADKKHVTDIGKRYNQDSVIYSEGGKHQMIYTVGDNTDQHHPGEGHAETPDAKDFYTEMSHSDGSKTKFSLNFDFDTLKKALRALRRWYYGP